MLPTQIGSDFKAFITLDEIAKGAMIDCGEDNDALYQKFLHWAIRGTNELTYDAFKNFKRVLVPVQTKLTNTGLKYAVLPDDFVNYISVSLINSCGEQLPLTYNPTMVADFTEPADADCHCDCGCTDAMCEEAREYTVETIDSVVVTPTKQCTYTTTIHSFYDFQAIGLVPVCNTGYPYTINTITFGTGSPITVGVTVNNGQEKLDLINSYVLGTTETFAMNVTDGCSNTYDHNYHGVYATVFPFTIDSYTKNGTTVTTGTLIANETQLDNYYVNSLGWTKTAQYTYELTTSSDVWGKFTTTYTNVNVTIDVDNFVEETSCAINNVSDTYTNTKKSIVNANGDVTMETCIYGIVPITEQNNYYIDLTGYGIAYPLTDGIINKNGDDIAMPTINSPAEMIDYFNSIGFLQMTADLSFGISATTDVYTTFSSVDNSLSIDFTSTATKQSAVAQTCTTEKICDVPVKECGCLEINDTIINTLVGCNCISGGTFDRYLYNCNYYATLKVPDNCWGYYNVDIYSKKVYLNPSFHEDAVLLTYYSAYESDSTQSLVPVQAQEALQAYIIWKYMWNKKNVGLGEKQRLEKYYYNEKHKLKQRLTPIRLDEILQVMRMNPRP